MADNKPMTKREQKALDAENTGNAEATVRVIKARALLRTGNGHRTQREQGKATK